MTLPYTPTAINAQIKPIARPISVPMMPMAQIHSVPVMPIISENIPVDLWDMLGAPDLPYGLLPKVIEEYALGMAQHMGADASGLAMASLTVAGSAISDKIKIQVKKHDAYWLEAPRLWTLLVGNPSTKKSPILSSAVRPIAQADSSLVRQWKREHEIWAALPKEERAGIPEPLQRRKRMQDTTVEAAQEVLKGSVDGVLVVQDEASGWFGSMERYTGGAKAALSDKAFWLQSYNGGEYCLNRVGRGSVVIENLSIAFLGGIQPDPLRKIAADASDDGLIQRMIPVMLKFPSVGSDVNCPDIQGIYDITVMMLGRIQCSENLRFDESAQNLRSEREARHLHLMSAEMVSSKFASHIGKYDGIFARLCVIWHCLENCNQAFLPPIVPYHTAERVAEFMDKFMIPHAACFYSSLGLSDDIDRIRDIAEHVIAKKLNRVTVRDVQRGTRAMRKMTRSDIVPIFQSLEAFGWGTFWVPQIPSSAPEFIVNPSVHTLFAERAEKERSRRESARTAMQECFGR